MASELDPVAGGPTAVAGFQVAGPPANPCLCRVPHGTLHHGILYRILRRDDDTAENQEDQGREKDDERRNTADRSPVEEETEEMMDGGTGGEVMGDTSPQGCPLQLQRHEQQKQHLDFQHYLNCQHQRPNSEDLELHNARQQNHETHCHLDWRPGDDDHPHRHQERDDQSRRRGRQRCGCGVRRRVLLRSPQHTWRAASAVLLKTARFVRNLPAFGLLPGPERTILLTSAWAPLFLLGLAQERVSVDAAEEVSSGSTSLLRTLLTGRGAQSDSETDTNGTTSCGRLTMVDIQKIRTFLAKFWSMDISAKEYGYLKGIVLFNPDSPGLHCWPHVQTLQREAQRALSEACGERPRGGGAAGGRLARLLLTLAQLHSIRAEALAELFFRPVLGPVSIAEVLLDMLDAK